jgi:hypothetical protein
MVPYEPPATLFVSIYGEFKPWSKEGLLRIKAEGVAIKGVAKSCLQHYHSSA